ncbi:MAG: hypothetical protein KA447_14120 [Pyrinomonadaceae bacterium]|nr:hypothetical protein [Pyrinomonadaceae bacterium]
MVGSNGNWPAVTGEFCLPVAVGIALILMGSLVITKWTGFGFWLGLALVGQAASLQLIDAGRMIHFQHYRSFAELVDQRQLPLALLLLQVIIVIINVVPKLNAIGRWLKRELGHWKLISILILISLAGAAVTPDLSIYGTSLVIGASVQIINIANLVLLAWAIPTSSISSLGDTIDRFLGNSVDGETIKAPRLDRFSSIAAICVVLMTGSLSYFVYQAHPHVPDETQYIFQARYMAAGQLTVNAPLVPEAFSMYMVPSQEPRWFSIFPPGWPALLAIGTVIGTSWLVNPLLAGLCVILAFFFFCEIYSRRFARVGTLLLCCSPWFIFMGMSYMSHISTLVFALVAAILMLREFKTRNTLYALGAGVVIGIVSLIRPLDAAALAILIGIWTLVKHSTWRSRSLAAAALFVGTAASSALILPYNKILTGHAFSLPIDFYYAKYSGPHSNAFGFGPDRGLGWGLDAFPGHSPFEAAINTALNVFQLNTELFGWGIGSLLFATLFLFSGTLAKKDLWAPLSILAIAGGYSLYWYHGGPDFGARYWFLCIIPLIVMTVRGFEWLAKSFQTANASSWRYDPRAVIVLATLCIISLISYIPWRASDKYYRYLEMQPGISRFSRQFDSEKSLVLIRGNEHPDYQSAWIYNPIDFDGGGTLYAFDKSPKILTELLKKYSDRKIWVVNGPTIANGEYRIESGPLDASEMLAEQETQRR